MLHHFQTPIARNLRLVNKVPIPNFRCKARSEKRDTVVGGEDAVFGDNAVQIVLLFLELFNGVSKIKTQVLVVLGELGTEQRRSFVVGTGIKRIDGALIQRTTTIEHTLNGQLQLGDRIQHDPTRLRVVVAIVAADAIIRTVIVVAAADVVVAVAMRRGKQRHRC